jgi:hypothetical protein
VIPVYHEAHFTFRFADTRTVPRFHLDGLEAGRPVSVFRLDPGTERPLDLLATAAVGAGGWVDLAEPLLVGPGRGFVVIPEPRL